MSPIRLNLIRYLIVCQVNSSMVWLSKSLSAEVSLVLGTLIADRLPTVQARPWHKALVPWDECGGISLLKKSRIKQVPDVSWPIEAVLFTYPGKRTYGDGELILWELKLLGNSADHNLFLEIILPALETAANTVNKDWQPLNCLWGHFNIHSIYVAKGDQWEPLVDNGKLDLRYPATPLQWSEGLEFHMNSSQKYNSLTWVTPFDLANYKKESDYEYRIKRIKPDELPTLKRILESLITRLTQLLPGKRPTQDDLWSLLGLEDEQFYREILDQASDIPLRYEAFQLASKSQPGRWIGKQKFTSIPDRVIPYLELASIFHIGNHTHFGCGTFVID